jgi:hypothetical protein
VLEEDDAVEARRREAREQLGRDLLVAQPRHERTRVDERVRHWVVLCDGRDELLRRPAI